MSFQEVLATPQKIFLVLEFVPGGELFDKIGILYTIHLVSFSFLIVFLELKWSWENSLKNKPFATFDN
jgi:hypothetical protein